MRGFSRRRLVCALVCLFTPIWAAFLPVALADDIHLAIKGYDPVSYFEQGKPAQGTASVEHVWDESRFRFSRPEHRELFRSNPTRYLPQFTNYCAMALARGIVKEANPEYWLISEGRLFLFSMAEGPKNFQQSLAENVAKANANRVLLPVK